MSCHAVSPYFRGTKVVHLPLRRKVSVPSGWFHDWADLRHLFTIGRNAADCSPVATTSAGPCGFKAHLRLPFARMGLFGLAANGVRRLSPRQRAGQSQEGHGSDGGAVNDLEYAALLAVSDEELRTDHGKHGEEAREEVNSDEETAYTKVWMQRIVRLRPSHRRGQPTTIRHAVTF